MQSSQDISQKESMVSPTEWVTVLEECASEADSIASYYFSKRDLDVDIKSDNSPVTQADQEIEKVIRNHLLAKHPNMGVIGEEFSDIQGDGQVRLYVDPIDGTSNFIRRIPIVGTLLAIEVNQKIVASVVSNGITKDRWKAAKGNGAFHNGQKIQVSSIADLNDSQAFYGSLFGREARGDFTKLTHMLSHSKRQRGIGDFLTHLWVAQGFGEFGIDFGLQPWDIAPLGLIVEEAGGQVTAVDGSSFNVHEGSVLSSNGLFHDRLVEIYNT